MPCVLRWRCGVGWAWVTKRKGCIIGGHLECNYLHPPSISIPLCGYVATVETASYHEERLYGTPNLLSLVIDDRFSTRSYPRICDFPRRFLHANDDRLSRPRTYAHTMTDRHISIFCDWSSFESECTFRSDNYQARYGSAICAILRTLPGWESFFAKENRRLCFLK